MKRPPMRSTPINPTTLRAPSDGFMPASSLPHAVREWLSFDIPSDEMRTSEVNEWADAQAKRWAFDRGTIVLGPTEWRINEMKVGALVALTSKPKPIDRLRQVNREKERARKVGAASRHPVSNCERCRVIATYPKHLSNGEVARLIGAGYTTDAVRYHRAAINAAEAS